MDPVLRVIRDALKDLLAGRGLNLDDLENSVRRLLVGGSSLQGYTNMFSSVMAYRQLSGWTFGAEPDVLLSYNGPLRVVGYVPTDVLARLLPQKFLQDWSPFRDAADLAACLPWLLRVHTHMRWDSGERVIQPAVSPLGGVATREGPLGLDWQVI